MSTVDLFHKFSTPQKTIIIEDFELFWYQIKDSIKNVADKFDTQWRKRYRTIGTEFLIAFIFKVVLSKNNQGYGSLLIELWEQLSKNNIKKPQAKPFSQSSVCEARQKLPETIFLDFNKRILNDWEITQGQNILFKGHRVFGIDGSKINLPPTLVDYDYKTPNDDTYYPQGLLSCLYELQTGLSYDFELVAHNNERICALNHLNVLRPNDITVFDRGYFSYDTLNKYTDKKVFTIFRLQKGTACKDFLDFWQSAELEKEMIFDPSRKTKYNLKQMDPDYNFKPIQIRLIKYTINNEIYVLLTTLFGPEYPREIFLDIYHARWSTEENYKNSKHSVEIEDFHAKTERGVKQELYAHFCLMNLSSILEYNTLINRNPLSPFLSKKRNEFYSVFNKLNTKIKINYKNTLLVLSRSIESVVFFTSIKFISEELPIMLNSIQNLCQKIRPNRNYPRISRKPINKWRNNNRVKLSRI